MIALDVDRRVDGWPLGFGVPIGGPGDRHVNSAVWGRREVGAEVDADFWLVGL